MESKILVLDTDFVWEYITGNLEAADHLSNGSFELIALSAITVAELIKGCGNKAKLQKLTKGIKEFIPIHLDVEISRNALDLVDKYHLSHNIGINDAFIAATCLYYNIELATCNIADYKYIPRLRLLHHNVTPKRKGWDFFL